MDRKIKVFHVMGMHEYSNWIENREIVNTIQEADVVFFEGGEDVNPKYYNAKTNSLSYFNTVRDEYEIGAFKKAVSMNKFIWGTCRGSQLTSIMAGGKLFQDIKHPSIHNIVTNEGEVIPSSSTHHQMQYPFNLPKEDYEILAWAEIQSPKHFIEENEEEMPEVDPEVVWYPKIKAIAFQPHPEYSWCPSECTNYAKKILNKYLCVD